MDSPQSIATMINLLTEIKGKVDRLDERSENYFKVQEAQAKDLLNLHNRVEVLEKDIAVIKRDRWWLGALTTALGGVIATAISFLRGM